MATVIDSLVVELGLDPSKFNLQQQEAFETAKRLEQQQLKAAKNIEHGAGKAAEAIGNIRTQALAMFAAFSGGQGLVQFGLNMTHANAQLGRLERNIGVSAGLVNQWQGAARIYGGSAEAMAQSFTSMSDAFAGFKLGQMSPVIGELRAIGAAGGHVIETFDGIDTMYKKLSANLKNIHDKDPATAGLLGRRLGLDPAFFDLLVQGPEKLQKVLDVVNKIGVATNADTDAFGELEKRISSMGLKAESVGRQVLGGENGLASKIMRLADWLNKSPGDAWDDFKGWISNGQARAGTAQASAPPVQAQKMLGGSVGSNGRFNSQSEKEAFIRAEAAKRGINPNIAMQVARSEGFANPIGDNGTSFGAFQLHVTPGGRGKAVGDQFRSKTGLDPSDPENEREGIRFALDNAKKNGWGDYHGAARVGIGPRQGLNEGGGGSSSSTEVHIGTVIVKAPETANATAWAAEFEAAVKNRAFAQQANAGQN